jgi:hypothetical protein
MDIRSKSAELVKAQHQIFEGKLLIWNTRLEAMIDAGDSKSVIEHLGTGVLDANNCGCNNGCGGYAALEAGAMR